MDKKRIIFAVLLAIFIAVLVYDVGIFRIDTAVRPEMGRNSGMPSLNIGLLDIKLSEYPGVKRDIFSPSLLKYSLVSPINMPASLPQAAIPQPTVIPQPVMPQPTPPPPELSALQLFASQTKLIGFVEKRDNRTVFISKGHEILMMKKGDIIEHRFRVESVSSSEIFIMDNFTGEQANILLKQ